MGFIIYILTYLNLIKWYQRDIPEYLIHDNDKYAFIFFKYNIKSGFDIYKYPVNEYIIIDNYKKQKRKNIINKYTKKLFYLLENKNINNYYIKNDTIECIFDIKIKRKYKLMLIQKQIKIID